MGCFLLSNFLSCCCCFSVPLRPTAAPAAAFVRRLLSFFTVKKFHLKEQQQQPKLLLRIFCQLTKPVFQRCHWFAINGLIYKFAYLKFM